MKDAAAFAKEYAERSGVTVEWLAEQGMTPRPCSCGYAGCEGWAIEYGRLYETEKERVRRRMLAMKEPGLT